MFRFKSATDKGVKKTLFICNFSPSFPVFSDPHSLSLNTQQILAAMYQVRSIVSLYPACLSEKNQYPEGEAEKTGTSESFGTVQPWTALWDKKCCVTILNIIKMTLL